ncbi:MAG: FAD-dependent oxidoreductase [Actinomycetota bacterium]|nr:FAD-dependent oxidoreductase [Actinomycetota bacterium]
MEETPTSARHATVLKQGMGCSTSSQETDCCIVGGGPAGLMLALLLARRGVRVTLLEAHRDFDREFRGNTINPSVMEVMEELGLAERLLGLRHAEVPRFTAQAADSSVVFADFRRLRTRYPYMLMLPQARFLEFIAAEARKYPNFRLVMGGRVKELIEEDGVICGVRYREPEGLCEVHAWLTIGADGRFSQMRRLAGLQSVKDLALMDVFWFNLPREPGDPKDAGAVFRLGPGSLLVLMEHFESWQVGYIVPKGGYKRLQAAGLPALRRSVAKLAPELAGRVGHLKDWKQGSLLSVEADRLHRWYRPGLLLIGDAAHVVSPVGGVGINLAIQDAVLAANLLTEPLKTGRLRAQDLRSVQRGREWPTCLVQGVQALVQRWVVSGALNASETYRLPVLLRLLLHIPFLRNLFTRLIAFGAWPVHAEAKRGGTSLCEEARAFPSRCNMRSI